MICPGALLAVSKPNCFMHLIPTRGSVLASFLSFPCVSLCWHRCHFCKGFIATDHVTLSRQEEDEVPG